MLNFPFPATIHFPYKSLLSHSVTEKWRRGSWYVKSLERCFGSFSLLYQGSVRCCPVSFCVFIVLFALFFFHTKAGYISSTAEKQNRAQLKACFHELGPMYCTDLALWDVATWHSIDHLAQTISNISFYGRHNGFALVFFCLQDVWIRVATSIPNLVKLELLYSVSLHPNSCRP